QRIGLRCLRCDRSHYDREYQEGVHGQDCGKNRNSRKGFLHAPVRYPVYVGVLIMVFGVPGPWSSGLSLLLSSISFFNKAAARGRRGRRIGASVEMFRLLSLLNVPNLLNPLHQPESAAVFIEQMRTRVRRRGPAV